MSEPPSAPPEEEISTSLKSPDVTPRRCLFGSALSGVMAIAMYRLTAAIAQNFAAHPMVSDNLYVMRISAAVRTLVVGGTTLATAIFTIVTLGLIALAVQVTLKRTKPNQSGRISG